jgi:adenylate cyclase
MSGNLPPETVVRLLNRYLREMTPIIFEHQGLLDKYMGDGLMALFGVPYEGQR